VTTTAETDLEAATMEHAKRASKAGPLTRTDPHALITEIDPVGTARDHAIMKVVNARTATGNADQTIVAGVTVVLLVSETETEIEAEIKMESARAPADNEIIADSAETDNHPITSRRLEMKSS